MKKLVEKEWNNYNVSEIFSKIQRGKRLKKADHVPGAVPYVSSTANNNGVDSFIEAVHGTRIFNDCISLANSGSVGTAFYEPFKFVASDHVTSLRREDTSKESYLFLSAMVEKQGVNFNFNREINDSRIKKMQLMLPVDDLGNPDYGYMTQYASEIRRGMLMRYRIYVASQLAQLEYKQIATLDKKEWKEFRLGKLFEISRPKARNKDHYEMGDIPFVASGATNNGVMKCCKPHMDEQLDAGNCITVSPVDGSSFYQPIDFLGRGGAGSSILMLRNNNLNLFRGEFMARMVQQTCSKYSYGHMGNKDSIKHERIMLPVNATGEPDYEYMEQYAKNMMLKKYRQYLEYLKGNIN
ncbi:restriction endonuclease subunit S [Limosilactobacillus allomucosae]|uniref:Restriction endonuclease subunit S n=1 Tax=Limosilactobacillus allomucosae TaxID=3142938 RepID=A0AAU7C5L6_9LACO